MVVPPPPCWPFVLIALFVVEYRLFKILFKNISDDAMPWLIVGINFVIFMAFMIFVMESMSRSR